MNNRIKLVKISGSTMIEYALIIGLIAAPSIVAIGALGNKLALIFTAVSTAINNVNNSI